MTHLYKMPQLTVNSTMLHGEKRKLVKEDLENKTLKELMDMVDSMEFMFLFIRQGS